MSLSQILLSVSLFLFFLESLFFVLIKREARKQQAKGPLMDQLRLLFEHLSPLHVFLYTLVYVGLLFLSKLWLPLFGLVFFIQGISLLMDVYLFIKL